MAVRRHNVNMDCSGRKFCLGRFEVNSHALLLFLGRSAATLPEIFVRDINGNEVGIDQVDYLGIGERTRPQGIAPASPTPDSDAAIPRDQDDAPILLFTEPQ